jgi:hypothetical protein
LGNLLGTIGLTLDILGVVFVYFLTKTKKIEAEIVTKAHRFLLDEAEGREWLGGIDGTIADRKTALQRAETRVKRNKWLLRVALGVLVLGFSLQILSLWIDDTSWGEFNAHFEPVLNELTARRNTNL